VFLSGTQPIRTQVLSAIGVLKDFPHQHSIYVQLACCWGLTPQEYFKFHATIMVFHCHIRLLQSLLFLLLLLGKHKVRDTDTPSKSFLAYKELYISSNCVFGTQHTPTLVCNGHVVVVFFQLCVTIILSENTTSFR